MKKEAVPAPAPALTCNVFKEKNFFFFLKMHVIN